MKPRQGGFVLIFVLLTVIALAGMVSFLRLKSFNALQTVKAEKVETSLFFSLPALLEFCRQKAGQVAQELSANGTEVLPPLEFDCSVEDFSVTASLSLETSLLDMNKASREELMAAFEKAGAPPERAEIMAESLLDWRDPDNEHRASGAEKDYYEKFGYAPRNGPLKLLGEAVLIRGFDPYFFWLKPGLYQLVTVFGGKDRLQEEPEPLPLNPRHWNKLRLVLHISYHGLSWRYLAVFEGQKLLYARFLP